MQNDDENPGHKMMTVRHLISDSCAHRRAAVVSRSPINLENHWGNIFSSKGGAQEEATGGEGE